MEKLQNLFQSLNYDIKNGKVLGRKKKQTSGHIWKPENGLVIISLLLLLPITNSINIKLNFQRSFDNPVSKYRIFFKTIYWMHWLYFRLFTNATVRTVG